VSPLSILLLEDSPLDAELIDAHLAEQGLNYTMERVDNGPAFRAALEARPPDLILADYALPGFDGLAALDLVRQMYPDVPFLVVSGTLGEEVAIETFKRGATDYVLKHRLERLGPAVKRALAEAAERAERKRAQGALRESQELFRLIVESARDYAIFTLDMDGRFTSWNPGAERLLGYAGPEVLGRGGALLFTPEDQAAGVARAEMETALARGRSADDRWHVRKDGSRFWASGLTMPLRDHAGAVRGFLKILRDMTEQKRAEEALREAGRRKDEFLAMLAHELRNPLAPVRNGLHLLRLRPDDAATVALARDIMERQVGHLVQIINDLLDVSRLTRGKVELHRERLDLARLARQCVADRRPTFDEAGVALAPDVPETPVWVFGDATRLAQVLDNLLENAAKFTGRGGEVDVRLTADGAGGRAVLVVRDTGVGIEPDLLPRIFEVFAQADRSLERTRGGLGLGLAIVKGLVDMHGGTVEAASRGEGTGTEFTITLPLEEEPPALTGRRVRPGPSRKHLRVLVVEDNLDSAESLRLLLELFGYQVTVAVTGPAGVAAARAGHPDVVICDLGLPGMDGFAVASALRHDPETAAARLIAVTGYGQEADKLRALEAGFNEHFTKPVDPEQLLCRLDPKPEQNGIGPGRG
jgi:PAS domain S-box-containing protein